jgi:YVTN family beta-propeller protein
MKKITNTFLAIISIFIFQSCDDSVTEIPESLGAYENGFFIINEGPYGSGNGSLTFVSTNFNSIEQNVYENINAEPLGNVVQSMTLHDDKAYIVVNNSHRVVIANRYTMEKTGSIETGLSNPRYMVTYNGTGYISNWGSPFDATDDYIAVIDLATDEITQTIPVGEGPEKMEVINGKVYVALQGAWGFNNKVAVIDTTNNAVLTNIEVGYVPNSMQVVDNNLYVLSAGIPSWSWTLEESAGEISKIDTNSQSVVETWNFTTTEHPSFLSFDGENLLYNLNANVYKWNGVDILPTTEEQDLGGFYYGMSARNGLLFTLNAGDFASEGTLKVFYLANNSEVQTITTGIIPNSVIFN